MTARAQHEDEGSGSDAGDGLRIGLVGSGSMATAMALGWARTAPDLARQLVLTDRGSGRASRLAERVGCTVAGSNRELVRQVDVVVLCVKPTDVEAVLREITDLLRPSVVVGSVAAGVRTAALERRLEGGVPVLRLMPNVPVRVGAGTLVHAWGSSPPSAERATAVLAAFRRLGTTVELDERLFDAATALSGSGPAFFALVVEAVEDAAVTAGLSASVGRELALTTMIGTAELLSEEQLSCSDLRRMVTSPGGTAAAGLAHLERSSVRGAIIDAVVAARDRARELGS